MCHLKENLIKEKKKKWRFTPFLSDAEKVPEYGMSILSAISADCLLGPGTELFFSFK